MAVVMVEHANQPIVKATDLQYGHKGLTILQTFVGELLEESVDPLGLCRHLPSLQDVAVLIAEGDRNLPCMLIDSQVQHDWFSWWVVGRKGQRLYLTNPMGEPLLLNAATLSKIPTRANQ